MPCLPLPLSLKFLPRLLLVGLRREAEDLVDRTALATSLQVSGRWTLQVSREHGVGRVAWRKGPSIPNLLASF